MSHSRTPGGVRLIAFLYYLGAVFGVLNGGVRPLSKDEMPNMVFPGLSSQSAGLVILGLGLFMFFLGNGLNKGESWARIAAVIVNVFVMVMSVESLSIGQGLFGKIEFGSALFVSLYLAFSQGSREHFS